MFASRAIAYGRRFDRLQENDQAARSRSLTTESLNAAKARLHLGLVQSICAETSRFHFFGNADLFRLIALCVF
jgi:hypothetical protein